MPWNSQQRHDNARCLGLNFCCLFQLRPSCSTALLGLKWECWQNTSQMGTEVILVSLFTDPDRQKAILNVLIIRHVNASTGCALQTGERENPPSKTFGPSSPFKLWQTPLASAKSERTGHKHGDSLRGIQLLPPATRVSGNSWAGTGIFMFTCFWQICWHNIV